MCLCVCVCVCVCACVFVCVYCTHVSAMTSESQPFAANYKLFSEVKLPPNEEGREMLISVLWLIAGPVRHSCVDSFQHAWVQEQMR